jgi:hypothetical protein
MAKTETIKVQVGEEVIELTGVEKEAFIADRDARLASYALLEAEYEAKRQQKLAILERIGLTEEELQIVLGA